MAQRWTANFLNLTVAVYRLAVRADAVLGVVRDVAAESFLTFRQQEVMFVDLSSYLGGQRRSCAPFAVVLETEPTWLAVGVDAVGNLRPGEEPTMVQVPSFGLRHADLFAGALRLEDRLLLVLQPTALRAAVAAAMAERDGTGRSTSDRGGES